ncbi:MAG TPA: RIP metalloprotease RseP [Geminicoccus sp.]|uniref:RIP metalloprotease RseP n=1 Tax=Geminicoccus sp. TaxID=2024832 RepID=UPI002C82FD78|nr:RIP metalloprotease RseP [Geminicoccus sp.]HWL67176.1 RIP metalloprotease RseP [Geminicoccus sp.]
MIGTLFQYIVPFLIILTVVVFVHEYGHFRVARACGVRVDVFSVGFGPELLGWTDRHGTRWKFSAIPLGGYVKMHGDLDAASARSDQTLAADRTAFPAKSVGQRAAIVFAGPAANFLFAILALTFLFVVSGRPFTPPVVGQVVESSPAAVAGILPGDRITAVDGTPVESFEQLQGLVSPRPGETVEVTLLRDGDQLTLPLVPELTELTDRFGNEHRIGRIGIGSSGIEFRRSSILSAPVEAVTETWKMVTGTLAGLWEMIVGARGTQELGGPIRIAQMSGEISQDGLVPAIWFTAVLSINLGLINLFPIPMLDGGHLVMYAAEAIRGRPLAERAQEMAFRFGLAMVLSLMVFATWNDLVNLKVIEFLKGWVS